MQVCVAVHATVISTVRYCWQVVSRAHIRSFIITNISRVIRKFSGPSHKLDPLTSTTMATALPCRLPSLSMAAAAPHNHYDGSFESNPCKVLTATSRYRNDPYRASVVQSTAVLLPDSASVPTPPSEPQMDKPAAPRRPHSLRGLPLPTLPAPASGMAKGRVDRRPRAPSTEPVSRPAGPPTEPHAVESSPNPTLRGPSKIALIQFKRTMMSALYDLSAFPDLSVGESVVVEGDRGEHIATVARVGVRKSKSTPTVLIRYATEQDLQQHRLVREDEAIALDTCRSHAQRLGLDPIMSVVDVEFQLDFQKLTVFFRPKDPSHFVDFRGLQRALYQHFRCRIWIVDC
jgi:hypothetical protein